MPKMNLKGINWVIVGGESGPGARPLERVGCWCARSLQKSKSSLLLQAMGWCAKEEGRQAARWQDVGGDATRYAFCKGVKIGDVTATILLEMGKLAILTPVSIMVS